MPGGKRNGFALADLVLTLGIGMVLVTIVWAQQTETGPGERPGSLIDSNERAAIAALRSIAFAQAQLASSGAIDTDGDGVGEYGFLGELAGTAPLRILDPVVDAPALDPNGQVLSPPLLPPAFGNVIFDGLFENVVLRDGYVFKMFLPDAPMANDVAGIYECGPWGIGGASAGHFPYPDTGEELWCCYAWPLDDHVTGHRVFFVNQEGRFLQSKNDGSGLVYDGLFDTPEFDAAYSARPEFPNGLTGMGAPLGSAPRRANDGNRWNPLGR